jgi:hypothetical protein
MKKICFISGIMLISFLVLWTGNLKAEENPLITKATTIGHDSIYKTMHGMKIKKVGDDSLIIYLKKNDFHDFHHFGDHDFPFWHKKDRYYGHWSGFEIGLGGYVNSDFNMSFPASQSYLNINTARSIMLNFNLFEFNLNLVKNHFGLTSGLGFQLNNYYFTDNQMLISDSTELIAYKIVDTYGNPVSPVVNKLFASWLNIPVLFEYQTNSRCKSNSFHVALGVVGGVRVGSYTKQTFHEEDVTYYLQDADGNNVAYFDLEHHVIRKHAPYHLSTFKADATIRVGWSFLNLFGTYSLTPMFLKDQGPELYMWNVGITLLPW